MRNFNINEFKKWINSETPKDDTKIGQIVFPKVSLKKIKNFLEDSASKKTILEFDKEGGEVIEESNDLLTIKVNKELIIINKKYTW